MSEAKNPPLCALCEERNAELTRLRGALAEAERDRDEALGRVRQLADGLLEALVALDSPYSAHDIYRPGRAKELRALATTPAREEER